MTKFLLDSQNHKIFEHRKLNLCKVHMYIIPFNSYLPHRAHPEVSCEYLKSFQDYLLLVREYVFKGNSTCLGIFKRGDHMTSGHQHCNIFILIFSIPDEACTDGLPVECFKYVLVW